MPNRSGVGNRSGASIRASPRMHSLMLFDHLIPVRERHCGPKISGTDENKPRVSPSLPSGIHEAESAVVEAREDVVGRDGVQLYVAVREHNTIVELIFRPGIVYAPTMSSNIEVLFDLFPKCNVLFMQQVLQSLNLIEPDTARPVASLACYEHFQGE
jgi:hypothetical protein